MDRGLTAPFRSNNQNFDIMKKIFSVAVIIAMIAVCVFLCLHWGFFGIIVSTIIYGLWANCTEEPSKK